MRDDEGLGHGGVFENKEVGLLGLMTTWWQWGEKKPSGTRIGGTAHVRRFMGHQTEASPTQIRLITEKLLITQDSALGTRELPRRRSLCPSGPDSSR